MSETKKVVGVVGLGLIGGSLLKAYNEAKDWTVYGYDKNTKVTKLALLSEDMDGELNEETLKECDLVLIALYPKVAIKYLQDNATIFKKGAFVIDCCGTKKGICDVGFALAKEHGFTYVGGHPMAGKHMSGYKYADSTLYIGSSMIIVPPEDNDIRLFDTLKTLLAPAQFGRLTVTTAQKHDEMIAFTSQLAHVVSNAYVKSPTAMAHKGFSAGSYRDLTRVAWLAEDMWTELFLENKEPLLFELRYIINSLKEYEQAIENDDAETLRKLLADGKQRKAEIDGNVK